jgi:hypothetical protein
VKPLRDRMVVKFFTIARRPGIRESLHGGRVSSKIARPSAAASRRSRLLDHPDAGPKRKWAP